MMTPEENFFYETGAAIDGAEQSQMFGKPCYKTGGKAFMCFFQNCIVCKLGADKHADALALEGSQLFDPSGKGRPMKEWVQITFQHKDRWQEFAEAALGYVSGK